MGGKGQGKMEEGRKELKGVRYANVGVGPDWARVWTFPVGRKELERELAVLCKRQRERTSKEKERGEEKEKESARDIVADQHREEEGRDTASRVGRISSNSQKFMAGASTYEQEVLHPGPTGSGAVRFTQRRQESEEKYERRALSR